MIWGSWENFLAMGGYAFYVWGSYLVTLVLMIVEIVSISLRRRNALQRLRVQTREGNR
jgi:heme exporter protein D